jgi:hypothetical protein
MEQKESDANDSFSNWRYKPILEWTDEQIAIRIAEYRDELGREWCGTLIWQAVKELENLQQQRHVDRLRSGGKASAAKRQDAQKKGNRNV